MGRTSQKVVRESYAVNGGARRRNCYEIVTYNPDGSKDYFFTTAYGSHDGNQVGNVYTADSWSDSRNTFTHDVKNSNNYGIRLKFNDTPDIVIEPAEATETISGELHVVFDSTWDDRFNLKGGVLTSELSGTAQEKWNKLESEASTVVIGANSTEREFTTPVASPSNLLNYGYALRAVDVNPRVEYWAPGSYMIAPVTAEMITYVRNPAAKGEISALSPAPYANIVQTEGTTISYRYDHNYGKYAQAYLSVIAENQDTGEVVTICRKKSVSVADGARGSFTIPAGTLGMGRWTFTICAAPSASASYYADSSDFWTTGQTFVYNVRENPSTASVECDGKPIPALEWDATYQAAYQVRFGDYDSGARVGSTPAFTVPRIFADGSYPVSVRSAVSSGDWSEWTETDYVTVENVEPQGDFSITAARQGENLVIAWSAFAAAVHYAVFRDDEMIAVLDPDATQYVDRYGAAGVYQVLAVTAGRYYKPSNRVAAALRPAVDLLSADGGYDWLRLRRTPDAKIQPEDVRTDVTYTYYSGRHKPVAFSTGHRTRTKSFSYIFGRYEREAARALRACEGHEVILKTTRGESIRGVLSEMNWGDARNPVVSFTVREIDGEEESLEYPA